MTCGRLARGARRARPGGGGRRAHHLDELVEHGAVVLGVAHGPRPPVDAHHGAVVEQDLVERDRRRSAPRRSR